MYAWTLSHIERNLSLSRTSNPKSARFRVDLRQVHENMTRDKIKHVKAVKTLPMVKNFDP